MKLAAVFVVFSALNPVAVGAKQLIAINAFADQLSVKHVLPAHLDPLSVAAAMNVVDLQGALISEATVGAFAPEQRQYPLAAQASPLSPIVILRA
jgi:hypothetical protein